ncbi:MobV family relaxase [Lacticaseibacillus paracasei]|uniref:MobV family relaxase n=3 Tax=Lacticaseibacillus paracasei TaxID=1597 RepID=UPI0021C4C3F9|nr:MobV family relaxase [Lacticaseibacillus paracasei]MCP9380255.1 plasmid recombination protein [Lacticaseibacillus paracasei]
MSQLAAHMQKFKIGNLGGLQRHDERTLQHHSNPDIDVSKSSDNFSVLPLERQNPKRSLHKQVQETIADERVSNRAVRKDAVVLTEWVISSDSTFFEGLSHDETKQFFTDAYQWFANHFGADHIPYATVHMDETTPHMHMGVIPLTNGRLSAKTIFNREALRFIQADLPQKLNEKGWNIERGERGSKRQHLSVERYKEVAESLKQGEPLFDVSKLQHERVPIVNMFNFVKGKEATQNYILPPEDYQRLTERVQGFSDLGHAAKEVNDLKTSLNARESRIREREKELDKREEVISKNENLIETYDFWYDQAYEQSDKVTKLQGQIKTLKAENKQWQQSYNKLVDAVHDMAKTIGTLIADYPAWEQKLTDFGQRVIRGTRAFAKNTLNKVHAYGAAEDIDTTVEISKSIEPDMYPEREQKRRQQRRRQQQQGLER